MCPVSAWLTTMLVAKRMKVERLKRPKASLALSMLSISSGVNRVGIAAPRFGLDTFACMVNMV